MVNHSSDTRRIAKNTLLLYVRMLFLMLVGLYTSRVVLGALGEDDFGIYNVVGGVVAMFSVISGSLSSAISRFITFELGKGNQQRLKLTFSTAVTVQICMALIVVALAEPLGIWFLNNKMTIPLERMTAANWVLQFSILTFVINLLSLPYNASIVAHERMSAFAYIGMFEGLGKLAVAFMILKSPTDRLVYYAALMCLLSLAVRLVYTIYCRRNFQECRFRLCLDKGLLKEMSGFAGWNFIGAASGILRDQGGNILINLFNGPVANAARGISVQLGGAVQSFVTNFMTAVNPQITKSYASGDRDYMMTLIFKGARFSFYLLLILSLPVLFNTEYILELWLKDVPARTMNFVSLALVLTMSESISNPLVTAMLATGRIRNYQIVVGGLQLMNLPLAYLVLRAGYPPESVLVVAIVVSQCCLAARLVMMRGMIGLPVWRFLKEVYLNVLAVAAIAGVVMLPVHRLMPDGLGGFLLSCCACVVVAGLSVCFVGLAKQERGVLWSKVSEMLGRLR